MRRLAPRRLGPPLAIVLLAAGLAFLGPRAGERIGGALRPPERLVPMAAAIPDDPDQQAGMEYWMLRDPRTGEVPRDIRRREVAFARSLPRGGVRVMRAGPSRALAAQGLVWTERGPNNVGGRSRVFAVDVSAPGTLIAGSVAGGIWRSTDDGASWSLRTAPGQIHGTTCIAQDRRSGKTGTWYVGTGEIRGSTTNATRWGSLYLGDGIFKSVDGGLSWTLLPATATGTPQTADPFDFVINVATNPANAIQDEVLAATYKGIYRSTDGGASWATAIAADSGFTDVAITAGGVYYASTRSGSLIRVWRSTDGTNWTLIQPGTFPSGANRIVFAPAPSNPNVLYLFVQGATNTPAVNGHQLWKYTYVSGDGAGAGGTWENRGASLPSDLSTQTGYDQIVHVKPDDEHFVLLGGTNLYRSTNGFASTAATTTIGGYPFYPAGNHHPDLHAGAFSPIDPKVYYSASDGGVSRAADITLPAMVWTSLNNGYNVTQFYSVAIAPDAGSDVILAGAQDNGSQLGTAPGASNWVLAYGGDGTIVEVSPAAENRLYTQYQNGPIQRQNWDGTNVTSITPSGAANQLFVNPIVLDPNVSARLYYAAGTSSSTSMVWRNDNAPAATPTTGWSSLAATNVGAGSGYARRISALGISTANAPNLLYYGTIDGIVMRAANVHTATPTVTTITPPGLGGGTITGGFVRAIAVDPEHSDRALLAFGNYNFPSLWYTSDGGATWTDVEGNLAGATGPSVRWATMFHFDGQRHVFLGTSIGVLSTTTLAGGATIWAQEAAETIGNVLIATMDYRASDATLAVGTHARGVFTTQMTAVAAAGDLAAPDDGVALGPGAPNPARDATTIAFALPRAAEVSLRLYDLAGRQVAVLADGVREAGRHEVRVDTRRLRSGVYAVVLKAGATERSRRLIVRR